MATVQWSAVSICLETQTATAKLARNVSDGIENNGIAVLAWVVVGIATREEVSQCSDIGDSLEERLAGRLVVFQRSGRQA